MLAGIFGGFACISGIGWVRSRYLENWLLSSMGAVSYSSRKPRFSVTRRVSLMSSCTKAAHCFSRMLYGLLMPANDGELMLPRSAVAYGSPLSVGSGLRNVLAVSA